MGGKEGGSGDFKTTWISNVYENIILYNSCTSEDVEAKRGCLREHFSLSDY